MTVLTPFAGDKLPDDVRANARRAKAAIDWNAPFQPSDDLRVTEPVATARVPRKVREHLAAMSPERRAQLEREWLDAEAAVWSVSNPISPEIKARADQEWASSEDTNV